MEDHGLTPRQVEVVRLLSLGCTVKETSKLLGLAAATVDNHKSRAMTAIPRGIGWVGGGSLRAVAGSWVPWALGQRSRDGTST